MAVQTEAEQKPIYWYVATQAPYRFRRPKVVSEAWVNTRLPVVSEEQIIPPMWVKRGPEAFERTEGEVRFGLQSAVSALRLDGKNEAADYWVALDKMYKQGLGGLAFRLSEGQLIDVETEQVVRIATIPFKEEEPSPIQ